MRRLTHVLFWAVIAAAFIGPGTVTTAAKAGQAHGAALVWALSFSILACFTLQEAAARLTIGSGRPLAAWIGHLGRGPRALVVGGVVIGCIAYEGGNMLGAAQGALLLHAGPGAAGWTGLVALLALLLLAVGRSQQVARSLGLAVGLMGLAFAVAAVGLRPDPAVWLPALVRPSIPEGGAGLVLGLIGTTVVPYNLFLGSGLAAGQRVVDMRLGLAVSVGLGGAISIAIVIAGSALEGAFSFAALSEVLADELGGWAGVAFAFGLAVAGFTSAVTAPLAAAITVRGGAGDEGAWAEGGLRFRGVWLGVVLLGAAFGVAGYRPVPAIIAAQALNGLLLPLVAAVLFLAVNDPRVLPPPYRNGLPANLWMLVVVGIAALLGGIQLARAVASAWGLQPPDPVSALRFGALAALVTEVGVLLAWRQLRRRSATGSLAA